MLKTMFKIIEWSLLGITACLCGLLLLSNYSHNFPLKAYTVLTGSMQPSIPVGSMVLAAPAQTANLDVGSIITFTSPQDPNKLIVHRIHAVDRQENQRAYTTKGDNNDSVDNWQIYDPQIKGEAILYIPSLGYLSGYSKTPRGFLTILGLPASLLALIYIRHIILGVKEYADHKAKKAVGEYIHSNRKAQVLHQMLKVFALFILLPTATVYAAFTSSVSAIEVTFSTAAQFQSTSPSASASSAPTSDPTASPSQTPSPSVLPTNVPSTTPTPSSSPTASAVPSGSPCASGCSTIILNQSGSSSSVYVHTTTGGTTVTVNGRPQSSSTTVQNTQIIIQSNTQ